MRKEEESEVVSTVKRGKSCLGQMGGFTVRFVGYQRVDIELSKRPWRRRKESRKRKG